MSKITSHAYDSGPVNTGGGCIAERGGGREAACGRYEHEHKYSEYVDKRNPGDMHEPPPYRAGGLAFDDDSYDHLLHPYVD
jgi:hypothetical protein